MTMQRRHFELIAETIKESAERRNYSNLQRRNISYDFSARLRATNPNFNTARFLKACGVEE